MVFYDRKAGFLQDAAGAIPGQVLSDAALLSTLSMAIKRVWASAAVFFAVLAISLLVNAQHGGLPRPKRKIVLLGPHDRYNFGDLLFEKIVSRLLVDRAVEAQFKKIFPEILKLEKENERKYYSDLIDWFDSDFIELNDSDSDSDFYEKLSSIQPLKKIISKHAYQLHEADQRFCMELFLWGLTVKNKLDRSENQLSFKISSKGFRHF